MVGERVSTKSRRGKSPAELRETAVSLFADPGSAARVPGALLRASSSALSRHLAEWVEANADAVLAAWGERDALRGKRGRLGRAAQASPTESTGRGDPLVLAPGGERIAIGAGEIHLTPLEKTSGYGFLFRFGRLGPPLPPFSALPFFALTRCASPRLLPALFAAFREVAQELARDRRGFPRHPHPRAAQHLLGLGGVGDRGGEQRDSQAPVLFAGRVHEAPRVAPVGAAGGVDEQAEQALRLRPALNRVLLVQLAGVGGEAPDQGLSLVAAADPLLDSAWRRIFGAGAILLAVQVATISTASSNGSGSRSAAASASAFKRS